jgi:hypothetical protein|tara:strand:+ start:898 stop:1044 length:147 start_codon:yes stop_codon:yes gene_type:complete
MSIIGYRADVTGGAIGSTGGGIGWPTETVEILIDRTPISGISATRRVA